MTRIQPSIVALLKHEWRDSGSLFDPRFTKQPKGSNYLYYPKDTGKDAANFISYDEAKALVESGEFGPLAHQNNGVIVINEHAQHALTDLMSDISRAYTLFRTRLARAALVK